MRSRVARNRSSKRCASSCTLVDAQLATFIEQFWDIFWDMLGYFGQFWDIWG
jgi:hypothetical protein